MKKFTYWIYYTSNDTLEAIDNFWYTASDSMIYAYTDNEKFAKEFEETYNMKLFVKKKARLTIDEIRELTLTERNRMLTHISLTAFDANRKKISLEVVGTIDDRHMMQGTVLNYTTQLMLKIPVLSFELVNALSYELYDVLRNLHYTDIVQMREGITDPDILNTESVGISLDEFELFLSVFSPVLKFG